MDLDVDSVLRVARRTAGGVAHGECCAEPVGLVIPEYPNELMSSPKPSEASLRLRGTDAERIPTVLDPGASTAVTL
ncbi:hypothetical protein AYL99_11972 [Fonsecaea erecta]|uniref:Uncharacterized protein n=1 Tax=Fonsecaea erecta TaxID=1367422 RepID=A0A178Z3Y7_9EURO|nr:hypothetical protein AYL99_11972 [Fonsecaea erecta]OAP53815.1 hypothetical protein AYL99_11972 [Fonsecaea erecta]